MGEKEDLEKEMQREMARIDAQYGEPQYKGQRCFALIGIISAGIIVALAINQLYKNLDLYTSKEFRETVLKKNLITSFAPIFWTFAAM